MKKSNGSSIPDHEREQLDQDISHYDLEYFEDEDGINHFTNDIEPYNSELGINLMDNHLDEERNDPFYHHHQAYDTSLPDELESELDEEEMEEKEDRTKEKDSRDKDMLQ